MNILEELKQQSQQQQRPLQKSPTSQPYTAPQQNTPTQQPSSLFNSEAKETKPSIIGLDFLANQEKVQQPSIQTRTHVPSQFRSETRVESSQPESSYNRSEFPTVHHSSSALDEDSDDDIGDDVSEISVDETSEVVIKEKRKLLFKIYCLEKKGITLSKKYSMGCTLQELQHEFDRISHEYQVQNSVKFSQKMLMMCVTGIEFLNNKFDPFDVMLDGWSESVHESITDYDEVFAELYDKYHTTATMAPEIKLLLMLGGSGFMFHLTQTMFKNNISMPMPQMNIPMQRPPTMSTQMNSPRRRPQMRGPVGVDSILTELKANSSDLDSLSDDSQSVISDLSEGNTRGFASQGRRKNKPSMHLKL